MDAAPPSPSKASTSSLGMASSQARAGDHSTALATIQAFLAPHKATTVSIEAVQAAASAVRLCNELALTCMRDADQPALLDAAYAYLKWALAAPHTGPALRAVTFNNAGIYYARTGQPQAALRCLERVGKQGGVVVEDDVSVHVKLNMTTVLADLGRHAEALEVAQEAVRTLVKQERLGKAVDASLLSAAYHNLAVQQVGDAASSSPWPPLPLLLLPACHCIFNPAACWLRMRSTLTLSCESESR